MCYKSLWVYRDMLLYETTMNPFSGWSAPELSPKSAGSCKGFREPLQSGLLSTYGFEELNSIKHSKY